MTLRKLWLLGVGLGALGIALAASAGGSGRWTERAPLGEPRQEVGVAALHGKIYVVGGIRADRSPADTVEVYDPERDAWERAAPLPEALHHVAVTVLDGKLYAVGGFRSGFRPTSAAFVYDPAEDRWERIAPLPRTRGALAAAALNGRIYAVGGDPNGWDLFVYDPSEDRWETRARMPTPRHHLAVAAIGGKLYAVGGRNRGSFTLSRLEAYDPETDTWEALPRMPTGRSGIAAAVVRGCLFVFGGEGNPRHPLGVFAQNERFNPRTGTWTSQAPMPTPRHGIGAGVLDGRVHLPGGAPVQGFGVTGVHEVYEPPEDLRCRPEEEVP